MKRKPVWPDLNPKAVINDALFSIINRATREWKDGMSYGARTQMYVHVCICYIETCMYSVHVYTLFFLMDYFKMILRPPKSYSLCFCFVLTFDLRP